VKTASHEKTKSHEEARFLQTILTHGMKKTVGGKKHYETTKSHKKNDGRCHGSRHRDQSWRRNETSVEPASRSRSPMVHTTSEAPCKREKLDQAEQRQHKGDSVEERLKRCLELTAEMDMQPEDNQAVDKNLGHHVQLMAVEDEEYSHSDSRDSDMEDDPIRRYSDQLFAQRVNAAIGREAPDCEPDLGRKSPDTCEPALGKQSPDICKPVTNRQGKSDQSTGIDALNDRLQELLGSIM